MFAFWLFQWIKGLSGGIVLVVSLLFAIVKDQVSSEEQMADISLFDRHDCHGIALHLLIILWSHNTQSKCCITDYILVRQQLYTQLTCHAVDSPPLKVVPPDCPRQNNRSPRTKYRSHTWSPPAADGPPCCRLWPFRNCLCHSTCIWRTAWTLPVQSKQGEATC